MIAIDRVVSDPLEDLSIRHDIRTGLGFRSLDAGCRCELPHSLQRLDGKLRFGGGREAVGVDDGRVIGVRAGNVDVSLRKGREDGGGQELVVVCHRLVIGIGSGAEAKILCLGPVGWEAIKLFKGGGGERFAIGDLLPA